MREWWQQLSSRDQRVALIGGTVALVLLYVLAVRLPAGDAVARLERQVQGQRALVSWMQQARHEIRTLRDGGDGDASRSGSGDQAVFAVAEENLEAAELSRFVRRVEPARDGGARLVFENVSFDTLVGWLTDLRNDHGLIAARLRVESTDTTGRVDARLILERAS